MTGAGRPLDPRAVTHSNRFRPYGNAVPRAVTRAYQGDLDRIAADTDEQCLAKVDEWLRGQGIEPADWWAPNPRSEP